MKSDARMPGGITPVNAPGVAKNLCLKIPTEFTVQTIAICLTIRRIINMGKRGDIK